MKLIGWLLTLTLVIGVGGCFKSETEETDTDGPAGLVGAWRSKVQFQSGAFSTVQDLEFMYVFNVGGTMTESSNYDAAPPVPPAYGVWRKLNDREYEAKYEFYLTRATTPAEDSANVTGWLPAGRGVLLETITVADDGHSFESKIRYNSYDIAGKANEGGGEATGTGMRIGF